jgi:hypothetical protein
MRLRSRNPTWSSVIALPDFRRYRDLYAETAGSLAAAGVEVWWVDESGGVRHALSGNEDGEEPNGLETEVRRCDAGTCGCSRTP